MISTWLQCMPWIQCYNSLWPSEAIWCYRSVSESSQNGHSDGSGAMKSLCRTLLVAASHYLSQCWLLISEILWCSPYSNLTANDHAAILYNEYVNYSSEVTAESHWGQWVTVILTLFHFPSSYFCDGVQSLDSHIGLRPTTSGLDLQLF